MFAIVCKFSRILFIACKFSRMLYSQVSFYQKMLMLSCSQCYTVNRITQKFILYRLFLQIEIEHTIKDFNSFYMEIPTTCFLAPLYGHDFKLGATAIKLWKKDNKGADLGLEQGTRLEGNWFWNLPLGQSTAQLELITPAEEYYIGAEVLFCPCRLITVFCHVTIIYGR